jgi:hypothetical protein
MRFTLLPLVNATARSPRRSRRADNCGCTESQRLPTETNDSDFRNESGGIRTPTLENIFAANIDKSSIELKDHFPIPFCIKLKGNAKLVPRRVAGIQNDCPI